MAARPKVFCFSDAWIFASLGPNTPPAEGIGLSVVIANADMLNHAIPTLEELRSAAVILFRYGLISLGHEGMTRTAHGQAVAENAFARRGGLFSIVSNTQAALNSNRIRHPLIESSFNLKWLSKRRYDSAVSAYHKLVPI